MHYRVVGGQDMGDRLIFCFEGGVVGVVSGGGGRPTNFCFMKLLDMLGMAGKYLAWPTRHHIMYGNTKYSPN